MIVVDSPRPANAVEEQHRRQVLSLLSTVHLLHEVDSLDQFTAWLDKNLDELEQAGFGRYLKRVILIGPLDGDVCHAIKARIGPGSSFRVLPVPQTWAWLWQERDKLLDGARRAG
ncbi:hypothetical protein LCGC14_0987150 [marine sediment metagenome]|uniref:Uncharacterized protein n=1 Tax=marine sediment metagenome TaxID=412755 RepID=A0A0F9QQB0_9ZZZZ